MKESDIRQNHEWSEGWHRVVGATVFDNSAMSVELLSQEIIRLAQSDR